MSETNRQGLSRHIPEAVAREVRQRSRFGCVVCRCAIYDYEHIEPEFSAAAVHDPDRICLLCGNCHDRVTRRRLSKAAVMEAYRRAQEGDVPPPFSEFDLSSRQLEITIGSNRFVAPRTIFQVDGQTLLAFTPPEDGEAFPKLNGRFLDSAGAGLVEIEDNRWTAPAVRWDITVRGPTITIRNGPREIALALRVHPPSGITVTALCMRLGDALAELRGEMLVVGRDRPNFRRLIGIQNTTMLGPANVARIGSAEGSPRGPGFQISPAEGLRIEGTDIALSVGSASMTIGKLMQLW